MNKSIIRINYLDGLRGVGALIVYIHHFVSAFLPGIYFQDWTLIHFTLERSLARSPLYFIFSGPMVVYVFFILSGIVLTKIAYEKISPDNLIYYLIKRYFRLSVPVMASILLAFVLLIGGYMFNSKAGIISESNNWLATFYNFVPDLGKALYQGSVGAIFWNQVTYNPLLWTVYYEFLGSVIVMSFVALLKNRRILKTIIAVGAVLMFPGSPITSFFIGMFIYEYKFILNKGISRVSKIAIACITYLLWDFSVNGFVTRTFSVKADISQYITDYQTILWIIVASGIIMLTIETRLIQRILNTKPIQFLGKISFSFYLIHLILICSVSSKIFLLVNNLLPSRYLVTTVITFVITTILTIVVSWIFARLVDEKGIKLSNKVFSLLSKGK
ncbi:MAG: acyltransferase [bacterium]